MGKKKNKKNKKNSGEIRSPQPMFPQAVDYAIAIQKELGKLADETVAKLKAEPTPIPYGWPDGHAARIGLQELASGNATRTGSFAIERCAGSAFLLGPDGSRWFATTELRAETIATVLNSHMGEYVTVRADILKRKGGVEV